MKNKAGWLYHPLFSWHNPNSDGGFMQEGPFIQPPLNYGTGIFLQRCESLVKVSGLHKQFVSLEFESASQEQLALVHTLDHIRNIEKKCALGGGDAGIYAPINYHSFEAARLAAGACLKAISSVINGEIGRAYCLVAPAGHHAEPEQAMGCCLFNNVAIGIRNIQCKGSLKVMIVDWDVHHGNGTQKIFYDDTSVLFISVHQAGLFPPTSGKTREAGEGKNRGLNINIPLPPGSGHGAYLAVVDQIIIPAALEFCPELIVVSAGLDASAFDQFGRMMCTSDTFYRMSKRMIEVADEVCDGRIVFCNEGGYSSWYLPILVLATAAAVAETSRPEDPFLHSLQSLPGQRLSQLQQRIINDIRSSHPIFN